MARHTVVVPGGCGKVRFKKMNALNLKKIFCAKKDSLANYPFF
jgi:hypothetical protein